MTLSVDARSLSKRFASKQAVSDVTIAIAEGQTHGLVGRNGAGKTTCIRMINGIILPDEGEILIEGRSPAEHRRHMGYLPEERGLYPDMTALAMAVYLGRLRGLSKTEAKKRAESQLEAWNIHPDIKVHKLSKGMAQAVQIVGTTLNDPRVLTLDEPFSGLDPIAQSQLEAMISDRRRRGLTTILSTHVMQQAEKLCDRVSVINKGRVVHDGSIDEARALLPLEGRVRVTGGADEGIAALLGQTAAKIDGLWHFRAPANTRNVAVDLIRALCDIGEVSEFTIERASLHDVFVELVREPLEGETIIDRNDNDDPRSIAA